MREYSQALALNAKTLLREARRINTAYAAKQIARSSEYVSRVAFRTLPGSFARLFAGSVTGTTVGYTSSLFQSNRRGFICYVP